MRDYIPAPDDTQPYVAPKALGASSPHAMELALADDASNPVVACDGKPATVANGISMLGYALGLWWVVGGPTWACIASILADEVDGRVARAMGEASCVGGYLDWAIDLSFTGLVAARLGILWALPAVTAAQVYARATGLREVPIGSPRALMMVAALLKHSPPLGSGKKK